jgi:hypothetical protein
MDREFTQRLKQEGYRVWAVDGEFLLIDVLGQFIDSRHQSEHAVIEYCDKNVFTFLDQFDQGA